jgi:hypothetical protein
MRTFLSIALPLIALSLFCSCAKDPVVQLLHSNGGFAAVHPPSSGELLGDVYRTTNLSEKSISMRDVMDEKSIEEMMKSRSEKVDIPSTSGTSVFNLTADAAYVGVAQADLELKGARKYHVSVSNPIVYDSPFDSHLIPVLISAIKNKFPNVPLEGRYIVRSLLQVGGLEYEFSREDGTKIDLGLDRNLVKNLTAKLGGGWSITKDGKLSISEPRFIGYRLARIQNDGGASGIAAGPAPAATPTTRSAKIKVISVPIKEDGGP